jgi:hypothetical protein
VPAQVEWDNIDERILYIQLLDRWTWDEAEPAFAEIAQRMASTSRPVSILIDLSRSAAIPADALSHALELLTSFPKNWELGVLVDGGAIVRALLRVFVQLHPSYGPRLRLASTLEEAHSIIASHRNPSG